jgi:predicted nucleic acid-binding protein
MLPLPWSAKHVDGKNPSHKLPGRQLRYVSRLEKSARFYSLESSRAVEVTSQRISMSILRLLGPPILTLIAVVDAGPLFAASDRSSADRERCLGILESFELELVIPTLVVTEVSYLLNRDFGPGAEATFLRGLSDFEIEAPLHQEWDAIAALVERYADFPLGTVDASVVILAERLNTDLIVTLDHRHFRAVRMRDGRPFRLLPE